MFAYNGKALARAFGRVDRIWIKVHATNTLDSQTLKLLTDSCNNSINMKKNNRLPDHKTTTVTTTVNQIELSHYYHYYLLNLKVMVGKIMI